MTTLLVFDDADEQTVIGTLEPSVCFSPVPARTAFDPIAVIPELVIREQVGRSSPDSSRKREEAIVDVAGVIDCWGFAAIRDANHSLRQPSRL